ncbi:MAG: S53 family peptidase [Chloroflexota bacterium]|nr:S53 family peptidase [Chloroflexota bacterium]
MKHAHKQRLYYAVPLIIMLTIVLLAGTFFYLQNVTKTSAHAAQNNFALRLTRPVYWMAGQATMGMQLVCQNANAQGRCYTPQQIQNAYNITPLYKSRTTGVGHTIVLIDAFQSPTLRHDLALFDRIFGLKDPKLQIFAPDGLVPFNPKDAAQVGWAGEITLDVEWAHAVAPGANIALVLANPLKVQSNTFSGFLLNILRATQFAVKNNLGDVISQSFGGNENCATPEVLQIQHQVFAAATAKKISLVASSGDMGAAQINCASTSFVKAVSTPASDPLVTAVGGTTLTANAANGEYMHETAWVGSGGGFSAVFPRPNFQGNAQTSKQRALPDVASVADPRTGVVVVWSSSGMGANLAAVFGGTSVGAPQWAGITVLTNERMGARIGFLNGALYRLGASAQAAKAFHDIVQGNNNFAGKDANGATVDVKGFHAAQGWDPVTGLGSPNVAELARLLPRFV